MYLISIKKTKKKPCQSCNLYLLSDVIKSSCLNTKLNSKRALSIKKIQKVEHNTFIILNVHGRPVKAIYLIRNISDSKCLWIWMINHILIYLEQCTVKNHIEFSR